MRSPELRRVVAFAAVIALLVGLQEAAARPASAEVFSHPGLALTVTGGPVTLIGDSADCSDPANAAQPAHLSGPVTVTYTSVPTGTTEMLTRVGNNSGFFEDDTPPAPVTVVNSGNGPGQLTCADANATDHTMKIEADAYGGSGQLDSAVGTLDLTATAAQDFGNPGLAFTSTGGPVALVGDAGNCSDPANAAQPAHLSGPVTITYTSVPTGTTEMLTRVGNNSGFFQDDSPPATVTVVNSGNGPGQLTCADANATDHTMKIEADAYGGTSPLDSVIGTLQLSNVD